MASGMTVEGMGELMERLREKQGAAAAAIERGLLERAAEPILADARENVHVRTGRLKGKIMVTKLRRTGSGAYVKIGVPRGEGVAYGIPLEWGHVNRDGSITAPKPFMQTAYASQKDAAYQIIRDGLREAVMEGGGG